MFFAASVSPLQHIWCRAAISLKDLFLTFWVAAVLLRNAGAYFTTISLVRNPTLALKVLHCVTEAFSSSLLLFLYLSIYFNQTLLFPEHTFFLPNVKHLELILCKITKVKHNSNKNFRWKKSNVRKFIKNIFLKVKF